MGLSWQQGPLAPGAIGHFLVPGPLPERMIFAERLRRRMRVRFGDQWIADSEHVVLLHEPGRYPVAYFPVGDIRPEALHPLERVTQHRDLGATSWYSVRLGTNLAERAAWQHIALPPYADDLRDRVAFAWRAMDSFWEEDERIVGHAADPYHRIDIRQSSRRLTVQSGGLIVADTARPLVLFESGFAPRWYVPPDDVDSRSLSPLGNHTFCPYKGVCSYFKVNGVEGAAWSYEDAWPEVQRVSGFFSFEADKISVELDGTRLEVESGQTVITHGIDRDITLDEVAPSRRG